MSDNYQVLARKYRPTTFDDLIGQEALVQTLTNAIEHNRLAQAYILTGIRGTGKTTSARIIAKALNCVGPDGKGGMTPHPCGKCQHCRDIANDCHMDVIEIDAASNTGVDNVREIIEGAKYNPLSARYKIYIIDEVHMLSKQAFNALLKTLEEPPERVKFIFATTEIRKVPITVLSRCQRFDLKRIEPEVLADYFKKILEKENATAEEDALKLICQGADGSARDGLSLLDQAIAQTGGHITADAVREMLGVSNKGALFDLLTALSEGKIETVLNLFSQSYLEGTDPQNLMQDLLSLVNFITKIKVVPALNQDAALSESEKERAKDLAQKLPLSRLSQIWQMLLKGMGEMRLSFSPYKTAEMLFIRICYAAELPSVEDILSEIKKKGITAFNTSSNEVPTVNSGISVSAVSTSLPSTETNNSRPIVKKSIVPAVATPSQSQPIKAEEKNVPADTVSSQTTSPTVVFTKVSDIVRQAKAKKKFMLAFQLETVSVKSMTNNRFIFAASPDLDSGFIPAVQSFLQDETGQNWAIEQINEKSAPTLQEQKKTFQSNIKNTLTQNPIVVETLKAFPNGKITNIRLSRELLEKDDVEEEFEEEE